MAGGSGAAALSRASESCVRGRSGCDIAVPPGHLPASYDGRVQRRHPSLIPTAVLLCVLAVMLLAISPGARLLEKLPMEANAADWIQAFAAVVLIGFTVVTLKANQKSADAAAASAEATHKAVQEAIKAREQARDHHVAALAEGEKQREVILSQFRLESTPVVTFTVESAGNELLNLGHARFDLVVRNVGRGPALDLTIKANSYAFRYAISARGRTPLDRPPHLRPNEPLVEPLVLASGDAVHLHVTSEWINAELVERSVAANEFGTVTAQYANIFGWRYQSSVTLPAVQPDAFVLEAEGVLLGPLQYTRLREQEHGTGLI